MLLQVASAKDVLSMSNEGTGGAFVNSHGYVHDMVTLHRATNATCEGEPETEHSWFPGYAWTFAYCAGCTSHLVGHGIFNEKERKTVHLMWCTVALKFEPNKCWLCV